MTSTPGDGGLMNVGRLRAIPPGVLFAFLGAALLGASTPCAKLLLGEAHFVLMAALLYSGSGIGLSLLRWPRGAGHAVVLDGMRRCGQSQFKIAHVTLQVEEAGCGGAANHV